MSLLRPRSRPTPTVPPQETIAANAPDKVGRRWQLFNCFVDNTLPCLTPSWSAVWVHLFRHANQTGQVRRSQQQIATGIGLDVRSVRRIIDRLTKLGLLRVLEKGNNLKGAASLYTIRGVVRDDPRRDPPDTDVR